MTPIDRAFIKAYSHHEQPAPPTVAEVSLQTVPLADAGELTLPEPESAPAEDDAAPASPTIFHPSLFQPSFQVDSFAWPSGCTRLGMLAPDQVDRLADALTRGLDRGQQVVAISGCGRGDGCTTLLLCVARRLAERGLRIAMVDADVDNPLLARRLGLLPEAGWEELLAGRLPLEEVMIESIQDQLALLPLCGSLPGENCPSEDVSRLAQNLNVLREHYDLVLVDWGRFDDAHRGDRPVAEAVLQWVDAVVLVHNVRSTEQSDLDRTRQRLGAAGLVEAGIAENFTDARQSA